MLVILAKAVALVVIVAVGFTIKRLGWAKASDFALLSSIVLRVTLPAALLTYFNGFDIGTGLLTISLIGVLVNVVQQAVGYILARGKPRADRAFAVLNSGSYNIGAFAMPYIAGVLGPGPVLYLSMFDIGNSVGAAGVGYGWGMTLAQEGRIGVAGVLRRVARSHLLWVYLGLTVFRLAGLHLPGVILTLTSTIGAANPFLAMLMIGVGLEVRLHPSKYRLAARFLAVRYALNKAMALVVWYLLPFNQDVRRVIAVLLFAPVAAMISGFTASASLDVESSAFITSVSIVVAIVVMPVLLMVLA
ncbi:MAG: hypothetical protein M0Z51_01825 [Propionibacterium sp.]|nr:hypothetical protein [Propionibacterium sp.]